MPTDARRGLILLLWQRGNGAPMTPVMARVADQILGVLDPLIEKVDDVLALAPDEVDAMLVGMAASA